MLLFTSSKNNSTFNIFQKKKVFFYLLFGLGSTSGIQADAENESKYRCEERQCQIKKTVKQTNGCKINLHAFSYVEISITVY